MDKIIAQDQQQIIALVAATMLFLHGLQECLAPERHLELYCTEKLKYKDENYKEYVMCSLRQDGLACMTGPIIFFLTTYKDLTYQDATGVVAISWLVLMLSFLLNEVPQRVGGSLRGLYVSITVFAFVAYATIFKTAQSDLAVKILAGFGLSHGLLVFLSPNLHASLWGNIQDDDILYVVRKGIGASLLTCNIYIASLIGGVKNPTAFGISWWTAFLTFFPQMDGFKKFKTDMVKIYAWIVLMVVFGITLTVQFPVEVVEEAAKAK
jgi:hypothetical protein